MKYHTIIFPHTLELALPIASFLANFKNFTGGIDGKLSNVLVQPTYSNLEPFQLILVNAFAIFSFFCEGTSHSYESKPSDTSSRIPEATAASQVNQKYLVIGFSVFGGVLGLLITTLIIKKVACRAKVTPYSSGNHQQQGGDSNLSFELLALSGKT